MKTILIALTMMLCCSLTTQAQRKQVYRNSYTDYSPKEMNEGFKVALNYGTNTTKKMHNFNYEFAYQVDIVMLAYDFTFLFPKSNYPLAHEFRLYVDALHTEDFMLKASPYFGYGWRFGYPNKPDDEIPGEYVRGENTKSFVYGLRLQYHKFIVTGALSGDIKMITFGFIGNLSKK